MDNLIEVVFEEIDVGLTENMLNYLFNRTLHKNVSNIASIEIDGIQSTFENLALKIRSRNFESIFINLHNFHLNEILVKNPSVQLFKNRDKIDISIIFNSNDIFQVENKNKIKPIFEFARNMAVAYNINSFYGGIEPAIDKATRIFTGSELGPIKLL